MLTRTDVIRFWTEFPFEAFLLDEKKSAWGLRIFWLIIPLEYAFAVISGLVTVSGNVLFAPVLVLIKMFVLLCLCYGISRAARRLGWPNIQDARLLLGAALSIWFATYVVAILAALLFGAWCEEDSCIAIGADPKTLGGPLQDWIINRSGLGETIGNWEYPQTVRASLVVMSAYAIVTYFIAAGLIGICNILRPHGRNERVAGSATAPYGIVALILTSLVNAIAISAFLAV
ncbi:MAG: hypothetical protein ACOZAM_00465 [Pseudomonadota bacterium]